jgi:serine/threonine protein kinase
VAETHSTVDDDIDPLAYSVASDPIGAGGFGAIHLVSNDRNKLVKVQTASPDTAREKATWLLLGVHGANQFVVTLFGSWTSGASTYLLMDYITGGDLAAHFASGAAVPESFITDGIKGLQHIHSCGVLHRDIKSTNLLVRVDSVTGERSLVVADFGISVFVESLAEGGRRWTCCGSPGYCAPEVLLSEPAGSGYGRAADVYSFGIVLFELMSGRCVAEEFCQLNGGNDFKFDLGYLEDCFYESDLSCIAGAATACVSSFEDERPTLDQLLEDVEEQLQ